MTDHAAGFFSILQACRGEKNLAQIRYRRAAPRHNQSDSADKNKHARELIVAPHVATPSIVFQAPASLGLAAKVAVCVANRRARTRATRRFCRRESAVLQGNGELCFGARRRRVELLTKMLYVFLVSQTPHCWEDDRSIFTSSMPPLHAPLDKYPGAPPRLLGPSTRRARPNHPAE